MKEKYYNESVPFTPQTAQQAKKSGKKIQSNS